MTKDATKTDAVHYAVEARRNSTEAAFHPINGTATLAEITTMNLNLGWRKYRTASVPPGAEK